MRRAVSLLLLFTILVSLTPGASLAAEAFSLRGGVRFGMTAAEVISTEELNGFSCDSTNAGGRLYDSGHDYQLYYGSGDGKLGSLQIWRYEYDFDCAERKMYQAEYVFQGQSAFSVLQSMLSGRYGAPGGGRNATEKYQEFGADTHSSHSRWELSDGAGGTVTIDLWDNAADICFMVCQAFGGQKAAEKAATEKVPVEKTPAETAAAKPQAPDLSSFALTAFSGGGTQFDAHITFGVEMTAEEWFAYSEIRAMLTVLLTLDMYGTGEGLVVLDFDQPTYVGRNGSDLIALYSTKQGTDQVLVILFNAVNGKGAYRYYDVPERSVSVYEAMMASYCKDGYYLNDPAHVNREVENMKQIIREFN